MCPVRHCGQRLTHAGRTWRCPDGHTFDIARSGYVNLLQPQDRKAAAPGDAKAAVDARMRLLDAGVGMGLFQAVADRAGTFGLPAGSVVAELGSGTGHALGPLVTRYGWTGIGIDLAASAAERAARRHPHVTWVVANADRRLPLADHSVALVLSLHARRNPAECARVLKPGGRLVVAVPAADDLLELREAVQGAGVERDRTSALVTEHAPAFTLLERASMRERYRLDGEALQWLLRATYRGARAGDAGRVAALDVLEVTLASELCVFASTA